MNAKTQMADTASLFDQHAAADGGRSFHELNSQALSRVLRSLTLNTRVLCSLTLQALHVLHGEDFFAFESQRKTPFEKGVTLNAQFRKASAGKGPFS